MPHITPLTLPAELIHEISKWVERQNDRKTLANLCLVSSALRDIAQRILLRQVMLGCFSDKLRKKYDQLKMLSTKTTRVTEFVQVLTIDYRGDFAKDPASVQTPLLKVMQKQLMPAIRALRNVHKVVWKIGTYDPKWLGEFVMESISGLPSLDELLLYNHSQASYVSRPILNFSLLSNLRKITVNWDSPFVQNEFADHMGALFLKCPNLTHLDLRVPILDIHRIFQPVTLQNYSMNIESLTLRKVDFHGLALKAVARHLASLKSFDYAETGIWVSFQIAPSTGLWETFSKSGIWLSSVSTNQQTQALLDYLALCRNLRVFRFLPSPPRNAAEDFRIELLTTLAKHHSHSLVELSIVSPFFGIPWGWPLPEGELALLKLLTKLEHFGIEIQFNYDPNDSNSDQAAETSGDPLHDLLSTCANAFPKLQRLDILLPMEMPMRFALYPYGHLGSKYNHPDEDPFMDSRLGNYAIDDATTHRFEVYAQNAIYVPRYDAAESRMVYQALVLL